MQTPRPGVVEHPDDDLWDSIGKASRKALAAVPGGANEVAAVGLCTIRFCRALLRADGSLATPVMSWMDERVSRPYEHIDPNVAYVTTSSGYISHRMTGAFKDTAANYQGVWPISTDRWEWLRDDEGFAEFGISREMLFELVMPGTLLGSVTARAARHTGIPAGVPVFATANDKAVEALGCGLRSRETLLVSLGTYIASMAIGDANRVGKAFWSNFASVPRRYLYESYGVRRGMWTVSWWRGLLGKTIEHGARRAGLSFEGYLDSRAADVPAGSDGLMAELDWLAPIEAPYKKGAILGFDVRHGPFHVHRAILEAIGLTMLLRASAMQDEIGRTFRELVISGGGSSSDLFMQIFADVFGVPAGRTKVNEAVGLGAAICAAVGSGWYGSWEDAIDHMVATGTTFAPIAANHARYAQMRPIYAEIPSYTDEIFKRSFEIFG